MVPRNLSSERIPDVLVARNESDRRSDCEIVKDLDALLVVDGGLAASEPRDVVFQWPANLVVIKSRSETIIFPPVKETTGK